MRSKTQAMSTKLGMLLTKTSIILAIANVVMANCSPRSVPAQPQAVVYTGKSIGPYLSEDLGKLLEKSSRKFKVTVAGPNIPGAPEITPELLSQATLIAFPGGPDVNMTLHTCEKFDDCDENKDNYDNAIKYKRMIQDFVRNGGHYLGVCLGAYLADSIGFDLLPKGVHSGSEIKRHGAPIDNASDTVVQIDYRFSNGSVQDGRWVYFQEGAVVTGLDPDSDHVVAQYSANDDVAASVTPYGKGFVGLVGFHPEADKSWYENQTFSNPDGYSPKIGLDFIEHIFQGK